MKDGSDLKAWDLVLYFLQENKGELDLALAVGLSTVRSPVR